MDMMFSNENCRDAGSGAASTAEVFADGEDNDAVATEEVASAVAAVSDEIGDILKDELGDADRADRIGAELADLTVELGLLAGLADGEAQPDFPSLFDIAMSQHDPGSGSSSSSTWSGGRSGRVRRAPRQLRAPRRRPINKGKEIFRRMGRRAAEARQQPEVMSEASDVGADTDSDDQWTELDDPCSSESSSAKEGVLVNQLDCNGYENKQEAEVPPMGQFLLPLLTAENDQASLPDHFLLRHEDILQLLASAEDSVRTAFPERENASVQSQFEIAESNLPSCPLIELDDEPISPEEEAALLHFFCEGEGAGLESDRSPEWVPPGELLLCMFHWWCENSALMFTMIGTTIRVVIEQPEWLYRARLNCHCRLCLSVVIGPLHLFLKNLLSALAHGENTARDAVLIMRALKLRDPTVELDPCSWNLPTVFPISEEGAAIIHQKLEELSCQSEIAKQIVDRVCLCQPEEQPLGAQNAVARFCRILQNYKAASICSFKAEILYSEEGGEGSGVGVRVAEEPTRRLEQYLMPHQTVLTKDRLLEVERRVNACDYLPPDFSFQCDCLTPKTLCAAQRETLLRLSIYGRTGERDVNRTNSDASKHEEKAPSQSQDVESSRDLQQGDGTGAKPPDSIEDPPAEKSEEMKDSGSDNQSLENESDGNTTVSLGLSTSSSLDSASELLLAAAAAVESDPETAPADLCRTVRHLMRSIASIERLMDRVLKHCDEWPATRADEHDHTRKRVDFGLSEVDRKLMAMYRRLPEVHRKQLQVYRKQKKLSTVCMQLVGGKAPPPPPPGSPPPCSPPHHAARNLCPEYHLQRFKEVRRKVLHMRDQQLYYHRLRMWLEDQLRHEKTRCLPEGSNVTLIEDLPRRKRRTASPILTRLTAAAKRKIRTHIAPAIVKPHKLLQMLKPNPNTQFREEDKIDVVAPLPFTYPQDVQEASDTDTIVDENNTEMCTEMKDFLIRFANVALSETNRTEETNPNQTDAYPKPVYPESISPPLQEISPTTLEPVYIPKPNQRLIKMNRLLKLTDMKPDVSQPIPLPDVVAVDSANTLVGAAVIEEKVVETPKPEGNTDEQIQTPNAMDASGKDPNIYKYVTFGLEIKKAMEECQNIINSYDTEDGSEEIVIETVDNIKKASENLNEEVAAALSIEQICEAMMTFDKKTENNDGDEPVDFNLANSKLAECVENMPHILANMPEIASKLSEFANSTFELPEFVSIMNSLPDINNEAQLTPETLKQIRELKLNKSRDNVKVTKNTAKRKTIRKLRNTIENDLIGTMTFEIDSKDISNIIKDEKELEDIIKNKATTKEDFKDLLFSISAQVVINKVFEYLKQSEEPEFAKCFEDDKELFSLPKSSFTTDEMLSKASTLLDNAVKDALSMCDLKQIVRCRFTAWKRYVAGKFQNIPRELLETEIEDILDKFYIYIQDLDERETEADVSRVLKKLYAEAENRNDETKTDITKPEQEELQGNDDSNTHVSPSLCQSGFTLDQIIMKIGKMKNKTNPFKNLKLCYLEVVQHCAESQELGGWILLDPEIAASVILEMTFIPSKKRDKSPDFTGMASDKKLDYFINRLQDMNRMFMMTLPRNSMSVDEWLIMLHRLDQLENKLRDNLMKLSQPPVTRPAQTQTQSNVSETHEAEILAGKGLSKLINQANNKNVKKPEPPKPKEKIEEKPAEKKEQPKFTPRTQLILKALEDIPETNHKERNEVLLNKCEAILTAKGEKSLLDSFYTIKSYITQGLPVPESYKKHVISICSSIDAKTLDDAVCKEGGSEAPEMPKPRLKCCPGCPEDGQTPNSTCKMRNPNYIAPHNPELLAKYSAQALRNAKQTLNAVAFRNMMKNGQRKSESDACDTPKSDCKWTNDCICTSCKNSESGSVCLGDIVKQCYDMEARQSKTNLEDKKVVVKDAKTQPVSVKPQAKPQVKQPKVCENIQHQQHVCKVGHTGGGACASEGGHHPNAPPGQDQPCTCCYCTVFGQAPQNTTPVSRNYNETRERLLSILNKKKLKSANNVEQDTQEKKQTIAAPSQEAQQPAPSTPTAQNKKPQQNVPRPAQQKPAPTAQIQPKTPEANDTQQNYLAEKMSKMMVSESQEPQKTKQLQKSVPVQVNVPPEVVPDSKALVEQQNLLIQQQQVRHEVRTPPLPAAANLTSQLQQQIKQQRRKIQQQQMMQHQRQEEHSLSSRDTSVFSTSSGCSGVSNWRSGCVSDGSRVEDTRDLDALLQYIEGPSRHVDRGKKRAKKQRQKAKKLEVRLSSERASVWRSLTLWRRSVIELRSAHSAASRRVEEARQALKNAQPPKKKGKKQKVNPAHQAQVQLAAEQFGELTALLHTATRKLRYAECHVAEYTARLHQMDYELGQARALQGSGEHKEQLLAQQQQQQQQQLAQQQQQQQEQLAQQQQQQQQLVQQQELHVQQIENIQHHNRLQQLHQQQQLLHHHQQRQMQHQLQLQQEQQQLKLQLLQREQQQQFQQQRQQLEEQEMRQLRQHQLETQRQAFQRLKLDKEKIEQMRQDDKKPTAAETTGRMVLVRRTGGDCVTVALPGQAEAPLSHLLHNNKHHNNVLNGREEPPQPKPPETQKKQTWEAALAHINQLAKTNGPKEKKKPKEAPAKTEAKSKDSPRTPSLTDAQPISKKQRRLLAKQLAEEEEAKRKQQQEAKNKRVESKKQEKVKQTTEPTKRETKKTTEVKKVKEEKKEKTAEKKGKENKQEKNAPPSGNKQQPKQPPQQQQPNPTPHNKSKKKPTEKPQIINITPDTTLELVTKKGACRNDSEKSPSCSIMEQLSCGVQVADLKLPPGITLTRVQPNEMKEPPIIKSVPVWKSNSLPAAPTPIARPPPVINADPGMMMFTTTQPEPPKPIITVETQIGKSKKAKKKAKKAATTSGDNNKQDGNKMVTLRNPMFHPNLPTVQLSSPPQKTLPESIRIPDPIPMPPNACQATITPTSNGMYTIRNPLMSMMHQQSLATVPPQSPQTMYNQPTPQYGPGYVNPNVYQPQQPHPPGQNYPVDPSKITDHQNSRIMNLASFTQKNDDGYSLFKTPEEKPRFLTQESYYVDNGGSSFVKPNVSPNPIGTRPNVESGRSFDSNESSSLFTNNAASRPEPIGTPLKSVETERNDYGCGLYTPFGQEDKIRSALFQNDKCDTNVNVVEDGVQNGDTLPYFQQLRVGAKLNSEVTIHHVTESKFFKGQEQQMEVNMLPKCEQESMYRSYPAKTWTSGYVTPSPSNSTSSISSNHFPKSSASSLYDSLSNSSSNSPHANADTKDEEGFGAIGTHSRNGLRPQLYYPETNSVFAPDRSITNLNELDSSERDIESFKRFDYYYEPPKNKPKINLNVHDIAAHLRPKDNK